MSIHTNIKEIIKKHGRGIINLTIAVGVSFILSAGSLYFSTGQFGIEMFKSYFANVYTKYGTYSFRYINSSYYC